MIDAKRLIAEVAARDGIRVEPGDPAFALVTLNQLVLEDAAEQIRDHIRAGMADFTESVRKTEARAGGVLAEQVKDAVAELRRELERDVEKARLEASQIVYAVQQAHTKAALTRWCVAGVIAAAGVFAAGLWIGAQCLR
jgi:hypothetical protein